MKSIHIIDILLQNQMSKYLKREGVDFRTTKFKDLDQKIILSCIKKVDYFKLFTAQYYEHYLIYSQEY